MKKIITKRNRKSVLRPFFSLFLILIISLLAIQSSVLGQEEVRVFITGPESLPINETAEYTIQIIGGPAEILKENETANWSYVASIGDFLKGADVNPKEANSTQNFFSVNLTAPEEAGKITLVINGNSSNETQSMESGNVIKKIEIFKPIIVNITATVHNPTDIDVQGAVISFYAKGQELGNLTEDIPANSSKELYWEWVAKQDDKGKKHIVEIRINEGGRLLEFDGGDNVITREIYIGQVPARPQHPIMVFNSGLILIIEIIAIIFVLGAYLMRRNTIRGRGYYSPRSTYSMYFTGIFLIALSIPVFAVSSILTENPDLGIDPVGRLIDGVLIFIFGFIIIMFNWDRTRRKRR
jgi:uncharacterized membrane-anchored protein